MSWDPLASLWQPGWERQEAFAARTLAPPARQYFIGLDLGQQSDPTAIAIAEQGHGPLGETDWERQVPAERRYAIRHLERLPLGTSYPAVVTRICALVAQPPLLGAAQLAVDATGVGLPVVDMLRAAPLYDTPLYPVLITSGDHVTEDRGIYHVPKRTLVAHLQVLLQAERLKIAAALAEAVTLTRELLNFKIRITDAGHDTYGAWREGTHDDLVLAAALAVWLGERGTAHVWFV